MNDLVQRLTHDQPVVVSLRPEPTVEAFKQALDRGYVHVLFTETRGGTELGVRIDPAYLELASADWERRTGTARLAGELVLDYVRVRCHAAIDLATLAGTGRLEPLEEVESGSSSAGAPQS
ncbi:MAG TPA: MbtH domain protein [Thermoanaerobaculia bacterium]